MNISLTSQYMVYPRSISHTILVRQIYPKQNFTITLTLWH